MIDGDLQHDETRLPEMLAALRPANTTWRSAAAMSRAATTRAWPAAGAMLSDGGIRLAQTFLPVQLTDPMSGFFMLPRPLFEELARRPDRPGFQDPAGPGAQRTSAVAGHRVPPCSTSGWPARASWMRWC